MTSQINPNNIDGTYPVAGQDNDSQGFRDNFTNTKTNFSYAAGEITDLQAKAVLKAPLTGTTLNNNMGGSILSNAQLQDMSETKVALGTQSGSVTLNYQAGPYYTLTTSGSVSLGFSNFPPAGEVGRMRLQITVSSVAHTMTLPAAVTVGTFNTAGLSGSILTFPTTGIFEYEFETSDGGSTITVNGLTLNKDPIYLPSGEDLAASAAASLAVTTSYFTTTTSETATLAAGSEGQIKIFAMKGDGGDMVITVTNAGWKSSGTGTITFNDIGDSCILQYISAKWFVIGNNGCTFA
jgi:hypothetical protein